MTEATWQDLFRQWKNLLEQGSKKDRHQPSLWFSIWRLITGHVWFQQELRACAAAEIHSSRLPSDLTHDLEHEVLLLLAGKLARRIDLGMKLEIAEQKFPAFLGTVIRNDCRQAARKLRRQFAHSASLPAPQHVEDRTAERTALVELSLEIEELEDPQRTILLLRVKGMTLREIAQQIRMNYSKVCREYHQACRQLKQTL